MLAYSQKLTLGRPNGHCTLWTLPVDWHLNTSFSAFAISNFVQWRCLMFSYCFQNKTCLKSGIKETNVMIIIDKFYIMAAVLICQSLKNLWWPLTNIEPPVCALTEKLVMFLNSGRGGGHSDYKPRGGGAGKSLHIWKTVLWNSFINRSFKEVSLWDDHTVFTWWTPQWWFEIDLQRSDCVICRHLYLKHKQSMNSGISSALFYQFIQMLCFGIHI